LGTRRVLPPCPTCQQPATKRNGRDRHGRQKYVCRPCRLMFTENTTSAFSGYRWLAAIPVTYGQRMRTVGAMAGSGREGVVGGRLRGKLLIFRLTARGFPAWASWWQPFGVEFLQEVVAKKGNASGQVR
jgi:hypothetical protein